MVWSNISLQQKQVHLIARQNDSYQTGITARVLYDGTIEDEKLSNAILGVVCGNPILTTSLLLKADEVLQSYGNNCKTGIMKFDSIEQLDEWGERLALETIDINGRLCELYGAQIGEKQYGFLVRMHSIIGDSWSVMVIARAFKSYCNEYTGENTSEYATYSYYEYIEKQNEYIISMRYKQDRAFWLNKFRGYKSNSAIRSTPITSYVGERYTAMLTEEEYTVIENYCTENHISVLTLFASALSIYYAREKNIDEFCIGTSAHSRRNDIEKNTVGLFSNTVALRIPVSVNESFLQNVNDTKQEFLESIKRANYNYALLSEELFEEDSFSGKPYDVIMSYQNIAPDDNDIKLFSCNHQTERLSISINMLGNKKIELAYDYLIGEFRETDIYYLHSHLVSLIIDGIANDDKSVASLNMLSDQECDLVVNAFNSTATEYPRDKTLTQLFEEQVARAPDNVAVVYEDEELTYSKLNEKANALAHKLRGFGVKADDFVAILAERSIEMIAGVYGIIKAGGAYVPIDTAYPEERIRYMLEDSKPKAVLTYRAEIEIETEIPVIDLGNPGVWVGAIENPENINSPEDLLYCIYTSGTTGKPKGVMIEHRNMVNYIQWVREYLGHGIIDMPLFTSIAFDLTGTTIFVPILTGCKIVIYDEDRDVMSILKAICEDGKANTIKLTPSHLMLLDKNSLERSKLESFILGGENLTYCALKLLYLGDCKYQIYNEYGPTEATVACSVFKVDNNRYSTTSVPIGKPASNSKIHILDGAGLCGIGVLGELCIAGDGLARGYLNQSEYTAEKFTDNPYGKGKLYRSGDLARWLPDGNIEYLGRIDEQVKVRGFRIEIGEIENEIKEIAYVKDCAVIVRDDASGDRAIYAYIVSDIEVRIMDIRDTLEKRLPEYMVPARMTQIEEIPVTRNGKLDKNALPDIDMKTEREYVMPRNEMEEKLVKIFEEILGVEKVGIKDNFFELGGHSLRVIRLVNRIEADTGTRVAMEKVFANPTVEGLTELVNGDEVGESSPIPKAKTKEFYTLSALQESIYISALMDKSSNAYSVFKAVHVENVDYEAILEAVKFIIRNNIALRTKFSIIDGIPMQSFRKPEECINEVITVMNTSINHIDDIIGDEHSRPFDIEKDWLVRITLIPIDEQANIIILNMHHIIADAESMDIIVEQFQTAIKAFSKEKELHIDTPDVTYVDFIDWSNTSISTKDKEYWETQLSEPLPVLDLLTDYPRNSFRTNEGGCIHFEFSKKDMDILNEASHRSGGSLYMTALSCVFVLMYRYTLQEDIIIGTVVSLREFSQMQNQVGLLMNILPMRLSLKEDVTFDQLNKKVREIIMEGFAHKYYPFSEILKFKGIKRPQGRNPVFDVLVHLVEESDSITNQEYEKIVISPVTVESKQSKYELVFNFRHSPNALRLDIEFSTQLFDISTIEIMIERLRSIINSIGNGKGNPVSEMDFGENIVLPGITSIIRSH